MAIVSRETSKKTILFISAKPLDTPTIDTDDEARRVQNAVNRSIFNVVRIPAARALDIQQSLLQWKPLIVHWSGHGMQPSRGGDGAAHERDLLPSEEEPQRGTLVVQDEHGNAQSVPTQALAELFEYLLLRKEIPTRCVVLNACFTEEQAAALAEHVDFVIGTTQAIPDKDAIVFSETFYYMIADGKSLMQAFELGRNAVKSSGGDGSILKCWARAATNPDKIFLLKRKLHWPAIAGGGGTVAALVAAVIALAGRNDFSGGACDGGICPDAAVDTSVPAAPDAGKVDPCPVTCCNIGIDCSKQKCPSGRACIPYPCDADLPEGDKYELRVGSLRNIKGVPDSANVCLRHPRDRNKNDGWKCWPTKKGIATTQTSDAPEPLVFTIRELLTPGVDIEIRPEEGSVIRASHPVTIPISSNGQAPGLHAAALCVGWKMHVSDHVAGADDYDVLVHLKGPL